MQRGGVQGRNSCETKIKVPQTVHWPRGDLHDVRVVYMELLNPFEVSCIKFLDERVAYVQKLDVSQVTRLKGAYFRLAQTQYT